MHTQGREQGDSFTIPSWQHRTGETAEQRSRPEINAETKNRRQPKAEAHAFHENTEIFISIHDQGRGKRHNFKESRSIHIMRDFFDGSKTESCRKCYLKHRKTNDSENISEIMQKSEYQRIEIHGCFKPISAANHA